MANLLPLRKYVKVWIKKRKNNPKNDGNCTVSYTLEWVDFGQRRFMSLGKHATAAYARQAAIQKEKELNSLENSECLDPITWDDFTKKYLDTFYPGHDLAPAERKAAAVKWGKSFKSMQREKLSINSFTELIRPQWCHEITAKDRELFIQKRLEQVNSPVSVDVDLRAFRLLFNVMEEWKHRPDNSNPFGGRGKATVGARRKRNKDREREKEAEYYTIPQVIALLDLFCLSRIWKIAPLGLA